MCSGERNTLLVGGREEAVDMRGGKGAPFHGVHEGAHFLAQGKEEKRGRPVPPPEREIRCSWGGRGSIE